MNDRQLRAFAAVGKTGSLSKAAGQMYISVPALKKQMDTLERELGVTLLLRTNQGVELTRAGEEFLSYVEHALAELDEVIDRMTQIQGGEAMSIRMGYDNSYVLDEVFYYAMAAFREREPKVNISTELTERFDGRRYDMFFGANYADAGEVTIHYLCDLPITCVIPKGHPLSGKRSVALEELIIEKLLFPPREMLAIGAPCLLEAIGTDVEFIRLSEVSGQYIKRGIMQSGVSVAIGFEEHINENLVQLPLEGYVFRYRIYSVGANEKPCLRRFIEFLKDFYPKKCAEMCAQLGLNA